MTTPKPVAWGNDGLDKLTRDPLVISGTLMCAETPKGTYMNQHSIGGLIERHFYGQHLVDSVYANVRITIELLPESESDDA